MNALNASDVVIIVMVVLGALAALLYYYNKKMTRQMIQAQDFIDQNRMTTQIFVIEKKQEKPSPSNLPKAVYEQLPKTAKMRKANLVRAKVGPQIITFMCDKPVYEVIALKKTIKVDVAGMYIIGVKGMNIENKKKKTWREKISIQAQRGMSGQSKDK